MKYSQAAGGRVFVARLDHGEIVHERIEALAREQGLGAAAVTAFGGVDAGSVLVVGPEDEAARPATPMTEALPGVHEAVGTGLIVPDDDGAPNLHMHMACGRNAATVTGCIRRGVKVWHTLEVYVHELLNSAAGRPVDEAFGFSLLDATHRADTVGLQIDPSAQVHPKAYLQGKISVGAYSKIGAGTVITGNVAIGHHTFVHCNVVIRGRNRIGNYTHVYDNVCIEGGRPAKVGSSTAETPDQSVIGDLCWVNHGATMHGTQLADRAAVGLNACCDYDTRLGEGAVLANGSATKRGQVIPADCMAQGVPASVQNEGLTDKDRAEYFGLVPAEWAKYAGDRFETARKEC